MSLLIQANPGIPRQMGIKWLCACVCVSKCVCVCVCVENQQTYFGSRCWCTDAKCRTNNIHKFIT